MKTISSFKELATENSVIWDLSRESLWYWQFDIVCKMQTVGWRIKNQNFGLWLSEKPWGICVECCQLNYFEFVGCILCAVIQLRNFIRFSWSDEIVDWCIVTWKINQLLVLYHRVTRWYLFTHAICAILCLHTSFACH